MLLIYYSRSICSWETRFENSAKRVPDEIVVHLIRTFHRLRRPLAFSETPSHPPIDGHVAYIVK